MVLACGVVLHERPTNRRAAGQGNARDEDSDPKDDELAPTRQRRIQQCIPVSGSGPQDPPNVGNFITSTSRVPAATHSPVHPTTHHDQCLFRGTLLEPAPQREIAIKKTWPENRERNFEMIFLTGISRKRHKNIVQMLFAFSNKVGKEQKVCESFVFDFLPDTLASIMKRGKLDTTDIKIYTWQLFNGLRYLSALFVVGPSCNPFQYQIVHRDIKPMNVLLDHMNGLLKIGDFGSAKVVQKVAKSTAYQVTRFYRAPELLLGAEYYNWTVDLWSAGCVVGEMLRGNVLFPGRNGKHQLKLIFLCIGSPTEEDVKLMRVPTRILFEGRVVVGTGLSQLCHGADPQLITLLEKILVYRPKDRLWGPELLKDKAFDSIFQPGAKRQNGQLISTIITAEDIQEMRQDRGTNSKVIMITPAMKQRLDFSCDEIPRKPAKQKLKAYSSRKSPQNREISKLKEDQTQQKQSTSGEPAKAGSDPAQAKSAAALTQEAPVRI
ncbi:kinase domain protein [Ancylostoma caninum]|uniref:Kinase domain protein n=1 Tax=Ancylostoma caninum TaxID=29170 RepID=A0A368H721_ANCCA|nr:kinase domain protein [Ancylostoma caninum]